MDKISYKEIEESIFWSVYNTQSGEKKISFQTKKLTNFLWNQGFRRFDTKKGLIPPRQYHS